MNWHLALKIFLRYYGTVSALAVVAVFMPLSWMDAAHRAIGLGPLPQDPITEYLARSLSAFYALHGGLLWFASFDTQRHRSLIAFLAWATFAFGAILLGMDLQLALPKWWIAGEGPVVIVIGGTVLALLRLTKKG